MLIWAIRDGHEEAVSSESNRTLVPANISSTQDTRAASCHDAYLELRFLLLNRLHRSPPSPSSIMAADVPPEGRELVARVLRARHAFEVLELSVVEQEEQSVKR